MVDNYLIGVCGVFSVYRVGVRVGSSATVVSACVVAQPW